MEIKPSNHTKPNNSVNNNNLSKKTQESKRIKQFRLSIANSIPKFPNNKDTLALLESKSIGSLLIDYINWASRLIQPRPRKITIEPTLTSDHRWKTFAPNIEALFEKVRAGENLNPYLSLRAFNNGFTPASSSTEPSTDRWEDKDLILNTMGYHHLHLSQVIEKSGYAKRTNEVLFAQITNDHFSAIGLFDHSVFERADQATKTMSTERERLWKIFDKRNSLGRKAGEFYISSPIATSGHSLHHTTLAMDFARIIHLVDQKLDDLSSRSELFKDLPHEVVKAMKLSWHLDYLNLGLIDKVTSNFYVFRYGNRYR